MKLVLSHVDVYQSVNKLLSLSKQSNNRIMFYPSKETNSIFVIAGEFTTVFSAIEVPASIDDNFTPCWVGAYELYAFVKSIHNTPNMIIQGTKTFWKFVIGDNSYKAKIIPDESFMLIAKPDGDAFKIKAKEVNNLSRASVLSAEKERYSGTYIIIENNYISFIATDGFGAGYVWFETGVDVEERMDFFVPSMGILEVTKVCSNKDSDVFIHYDNHKVHFVSDDVWVIVNEIKGKEQYPADRIRQSLSKELEEGVEVPLSDLIDRLTACATVKGQYNEKSVTRVKVLHEGGGSDLIVAASNDDKSMKMHVPVFREIGSGDLDFYIDPKYIQIATNLLVQLGDTQSVYINNSSELNWIFITAKDVNGRFAFAKMVVKQ